MIPSVKTDEFPYASLTRITLSFSFFVVLLSSSVFNMKVHSCTHSFTLFALSFFAIHSASALSVDSKGKPLLTILDHTMY